MGRRRRRKVGVVRRKNVAFQRAWTFRGKEQFRFNEVDGKVDRRSFMGKYEVLDGVPRCLCVHVSVCVTVSTQDCSTLQLKYI
jgi:hypothetical protein